MPSPPALALDCGLIVICSNHFHICHFRWSWWQGGWEGGTTDSQIGKRWLFRRASLCSVNFCHCTDIDFYHFFHSLYKFNLRIFRSTFEHFWLMNVFIICVFLYLGIDGQTGTLSLSHSLPVQPAKCSNFAHLLSFQLNLKSHPAGPIHFCIYVFVFVFIFVFVFVNLFWSCRHVFSSLWTNVSKVTSL